MTPADQRRRQTMKELGHVLPPMMRFRVTCQGVTCLLSRSPQIYESMPEALTLKVAHFGIFGPGHGVEIEEVRG